MYFAGLPASDVTLKLLTQRKKFINLQSIWSEGEPFSIKRVY